MEDLHLRIASMADPGRHGYLLELRAPTELAATRLEEIAQRKSSEQPRRRCVKSIQNSERATEDGSTKKKTEENPKHGTRS